jgi:hypothetical protein
MRSEVPTTFFGFDSPFSLQCPASLAHRGELKPQDIHHAPPGPLHGGRGLRNVVGGDDRFYKDILQPARSELTAIHHGFTAYRRPFRTAPMTVGRTRKW